MSNGNYWNHCFQKPRKIRKEAVLLATIARFWKAFFGSCVPVHAGRTCRIDTQVHRSAGGGYNYGRTWEYGLISGANSFPCSMKKERWIGKKPLSMAALLRQKKGLLRRENQKGQGNKVDGGGRRPRYSFGKHPCPGIAG